MLRVLTCRSIKKESGFDEIVILEGDFI